MSVILSVSDGYGQIIILTDYIIIDKKILKLLSKRLLNCIPSNCYFIGDYSSDKNIIIFFKNSIPDSFSVSIDTIKYEIFNHLCYKCNNLENNSMELINFIKMLKEFIHDKKT